MASEHKTTSGQLGHLDSRRVDEIQRLHNEAIQAIEAFYSYVFSSVDPNRYTLTQWLRGPLWTDLHTRFGKSAWKIYNPLSDAILRASWLEPIRLEAKARSFSGSNRTDKPPRNSTVGRRLSSDARARLQRYLSKPPTKGDEGV